MENLFKKGAIFIHGRVLRSMGLVTHMTYVTSFWELAPRNLKVFARISLQFECRSAKTSFSKMPHRCVCANCGNTRDVAKNISLHTVPYYGNERQEQKRRRKRWVDFVNPNAHTGNLRRPRILQLLYCRARIFTFVARCCVSYHGYLSLDPFFSIVAAYFKAVHKIEG